MAAWGISRQNGPEVRRCDGSSGSQMRRAQSSVRRSIWLCRGCAPFVGPQSKGRAFADLLVETFIHQPALLRTSRHSFRLRPGSGHPLHGSDRRPARLQPRSRRCALDEISRALVHALNYGDRLDLAPMMGRWLGHAGDELLADADALIPVPLHWRRNWARRFNQSAMLAAAVSTTSGVPVAAGALKRVKATI